LSLEALAIHLDLVDLHLNEALAVALQLLVLLLPLVVEDKDLVAAALADDLGQHLRAAQLLLKLALVAAHRQHIRELQRAIVLALLNPQRVAGSHAVLLAAGTNDCVHNSNLSRGRTHALPQKISLDKLFALSIDALIRRRLPRQLRPALPTLWNLQVAS